MAPDWTLIRDSRTRSGDSRPVRGFVNDRKFPVRTVFFSHTKPINSNNPRSYTIISAPAEQAERSADGTSTATYLMHHLRPDNMANALCGSAVGSPESPEYRSRSIP